MENSTQEKCPHNFEAISLILHTVIKNAMCTNKLSFLKKNFKCQTKFENK